MGGNSVYHEIRGTGQGIRCPRNYLLKPGHNPFKMVINPLLKNVTQANCDALSRVFKTPIRKWIKARDKNGQPIQDFNNYMQPVISAALAREKIYQEFNPICATCKRCLIK
jgi:hypothetical protein